MKIKMYLGGVAVTDDVLIFETDNDDAIITLRANVDPSSWFSDVVLVVQYEHARVTYRIKSISDRSTDMIKLTRIPAHTGVSVVVPERVTYCVDARGSTLHFETDGDWRLEGGKLVSASIDGWSPDDYLIRQVQHVSRWVNSCWVFTSKLTIMSW